MDKLIAQLAQIALFSIPLTLSPGPNNLMMTANCARFGYRRTLPSLAGVSAGVVTLFLLVALGLGGVLIQHPQLHIALKATGCAYILYLSWRLFSARGGASGAEAADRPVTFAQAALLQIVNPKIWLLALAACSTFLPLTGNFVVDATILAITLGVIFFPCNSLWALFGLMMRQALRGRMFQRVMGLVTASSILFLLY
ncbi:LysE family translocator [Burkholderia sp. Ax-1719]|uniref:LysE family translocator n=1 Tax=Burkholderia sp. Ax-1719 TaxID=2608334 RepID=UPI00142301D8|nr:LysE family translocator [Burkholderia sp. Ax-1719]NIE65419.1 LysE family translocator [Burkholderia sp. Ax-1719]